MEITLLKPNRCQEETVDLTKVSSSFTSGLEAEPKLIFSLNQFETTKKEEDFIYELSSIDLTSDIGKSQNITIMYSYIDRKKVIRTTPFLIISQYFFNKSASQSIIRQASE